MSDTNQLPDNTPGAVADAQSGNLVDRHAPPWLKPYARLARWDRPIGIWLLFWPCIWGLALAAVANPGRGFDWWAGVLMFLGAALMRGAGCTFNDIVDRDIDMQVARTRSRPIPSGQVTTREALYFMIAQALLASVILFQFNRFTVWACVASLVLVAIYPFMKRITWWPQAFLGLAFSYGALVGWSSQTGGLGWVPVLLYVGTILWVIGYDTLYALQDIEDDALIGVKSTARLFGNYVKPVVAGLYAGAFVLWMAAALMVGAGLVFAVLSMVAVGLLAWQVWTIDPEQPDNPRSRFYTNHYVGVVLALALLAEWVW
ncbi:4-hydroxybenzoate octaprenyltransferase [Devosia psychrophila]|jgi:4-hydroxybenzoate polyprenyltransferase|uniref:4-hydroxybenzoate octaprenyltransferase n=1 Tax=Devosia psychrophila TaxID=728005 RepID=A0A0F5PWW5_9HYPH|nr:4-hydroxybenzoate octaprenyltransferase [Devosia psychrophila]KKC33157.1 4-hydroxybenzoate polyprenyltransferase [Devosia psychrophila]SFC29372.1 4-hydroxybenzoate polyprenyltransferase [Devosia psychrophila]